MTVATTSFNFHPTRDLDVKVASLNELTPTHSDIYCVELAEGGHHVTIFFSSGEALTEFSDSLQQKILDARMAQEGMPT